MTHGLTDVAGILVGHAHDHDAITGCTVVLCPEGAAGGYSIGGAATGTQELNLLNPDHVTRTIHGICLSGGSAFGLEAASGVRRYLEEKGIGYQTAAGVVPLVTGAILYDLGIGKASVRPTRETGYAAAKAATAGPIQEGCVGAGAGATVGKMRGMKQAMKGGIGTWSVQLGDVTVAALAAVNALGDVVHPRTRTIIAGTRSATDRKDFLNSAELLKQGRPTPAMTGGNTTLVVLATDARLDKVQANRLAKLAQHGLTATIAPAHTMFDGDIVFALSVGTKSADFSALGVVAAEVVAEAIVRGARMSWSLGGVPGLAPAP